jgi:hypothetical protein
LNMDSRSGSQVLTRSTGDWSTLYSFLCRAFPLGTRWGQVGTLCVTDRHPRELSSSDLTTFRDLAAWAESELRVVCLSQAQVDLIAELNRVRRQAMLDSLTRLWNREAVLDVLQRELARARRKQSCVSVILADLDHFKTSMIPRDTWQATPSSAKQPKGCGLWSDPMT